MPQGPLWTHEIKHDGYRLIARKDGDQVQLWSRNGRDWTREFAAIRNALAALPVDGLVLDGEAVAHCEDGLPDFWRLRSSDGLATACLYAFDLLFNDNQDLRPKPLDERRLRLATVLDGAEPALREVEHLEGHGELMYYHACGFGLEGISRKGGTGPIARGGATTGAKPRTRPR